MLNSNFKYSQKLGTFAEHWANLIKMEELYGLDWARPVHWAELPKFLRPDALIQESQSWKRNA